MINKITKSIGVLLLCASLNSGAEIVEKVGLDNTLLCIAEYFSESKFTEDPFKLVDIKSGISASKFLVSVDGVQWFNGGIVSRHCRTTYALITCEIFSLDDETTFTIFRDSGAFRVSFWALPADETDEHSYYVTRLGACAILPGTYNPEGLDTLARAYLMTTTASPLGNISELHIINTSSVDQEFHGTLYEYTGTQLGASRTPLHPGVIAPHGRLIITSADLEDILGIEPWKHPAVLDVFGSADFKLMIRLTSPSGFVSNTNCVTENEVHNIGGSDSPDLTFIRFINIGDTFIDNIHGNLYDADGNNIGTPDAGIPPFFLLPREQYWVNSNTLAAWFGSSWTGAATLKISAHDNIRLLNLNFVNSLTFFNFSCIESAN